MGFTAYLFLHGFTRFSCRMCRKVYQMFTKNKVVVYRQFTKLKLDKTTVYKYRHINLIIIS